MHVNGLLVAGAVLKPSAPAFALPPVFFVVPGLSLPVASAQLPAFVAVFPGLFPPVAAFRLLVSTVKCQFSLLCIQPLKLTHCKRNHFSMPVVGSIVQSIKTS